MPFVSQAQAGWAHTHPDEFGRKNLAEWDAATKGKSLPKRVANEGKEEYKASGLSGVRHK